MNSTERVRNVILGKPVDRQPLYGWVEFNLKDQITERWGSVADFEDKYEFDIAHIFGGPCNFNYQVLNELKAEYYIPYAIDCMIKDGTGKTEVLSTPSRWFGVTFKEDRPGVVAKFQEFADQGIYPTPLYK